MTIHRGSLAAVLAAAFLASLPAAAQTPVVTAPPENPPTATIPAPPEEPVRTGPSVGLFLDGTLEMGGDRVAETFFEDGDSQTMRAGQGGSVSAGLELRPSAASPFAVRGTVGFKYVTTAATNVDIKLTRIPIEVVGTYTLPNGVFAGAGVVHHARIRFDGGGLAEDVDFDPATGATVEAGWKWIALTYTHLTYTDEFGNEYDAGAPGISVRGTFRLR